jgi:hypothetical protein
MEEIIARAIRRRVMVMMASIATRIIPEKTQADWTVSVQSA